MSEEKLLAKRIKFAKLLKELKDENLPSFEEFKKNADQLEDDLTAIWEMGKKYDKENIKKK